MDTRNAGDTCAAVLHAALAASVSGGAASARCGLHDLSARLDAPGGHALAVAAVKDPSLPSALARCATNLPAGVLPSLLRCWRRLLWHGQSRKIAAPLWSEAVFEVLLVAALTSVEGAPSARVDDNNNNNNNDEDGDTAASALADIADALCWHGGSDADAWRAAGRAIQAPERVFAALAASTTAPDADAPSAPATTAAHATILRHLLAGSARLRATASTDGGDDSGNDDDGDREDSNRGVHRVDQHQQQQQSPIMRLHNASFATLLSVAAAAATRARAAVAGSAGDAADAADAARRCEAAEAVLLCAAAAAATLPTLADAAAAAVTATPPQQLCSKDSHDAETAAALAISALLQAEPPAMGGGSNTSSSGGAPPQGAPGVLVRRGSRGGGRVASALRDAQRAAQVLAGSLGAALAPDGHWWWNCGHSNTNEAAWGAVFLAAVSPAVASSGGGATAFVASRLPPLLAALRREQLAATGDGGERAMAAVAALVAGPGPSPVLWPPLQPAASGSAAGERDGGNSGGGGGDPSFATASGLRRRVASAARLGYARYTADAQYAFVTAPAGSGGTPAPFAATIVALASVDECLSVACCRALTAAVRGCPRAAERAVAGGLLPLLDDVFGDYSGDVLRAALGLLAALVPTLLALPAMRGDVGNAAVSTRHSASPFAAVSRRRFLSSAAALTESGVLQRFSGSSPVLLRAALSAQGTPSGVRDAALALLEALQEARCTTEGSDESSVQGGIGDSGQAGANGASPLLTLVAAAIDSSVPHAIAAILACDEDDTVDSVAAEAALSQPQAPLGEPAEDESDVSGDDVVDGGCSPDRLGMSRVASIPTTAASGGHTSAAVAARAFRFLCSLGAPAVVSLVALIEDASAFATADATRLRDSAGVFWRWDPPLDTPSDADDACDVLVAAVPLLNGLLCEDEICRDAFVRCGGASALVWVLGSTKPNPTAVAATTTAVVLPLPLRGVALFALLNTLAYNSIPGTAAAVAAEAVRLTAETSLLCSLNAVVAAVEGRQPEAGEVAGDATQRDIRDAAFALFERLVLLHRKLRCPTTPLLLATPAVMRCMLCDAVSTPSAMVVVGPATSLFLCLLQADEDSQVLRNYHCDAVVEVLGALAEAHESRDVRAQAAMYLREHSRTV